MSAKRGDLVLIKVGNGEEPELFNTVGGLRTSNFILNSRMLDATSLSDGKWRKLLNGAGMQSLRISGSGIFTNSEAEDTVRGYAFGNSIQNYRFVFASGDFITGPFLIAAYERSGNHDGEEVYAIALESAGVINYTAS